MNPQWTIANDAYGASVGRLNAIAARGDLGSVHIAHAYRMELKTTLRSMRQLIAATSDDAELQRCYQGMLSSLKHMHYNLIMVEAVAVELAMRRN